jgi:hypothetical protein
MDLQPFFSRECSESAAEYPEDESLGELQTDYDVQNDETFGADFMPSDNDMEEFANMVFINWLLMLQFCLNAIFKGSRSCH